MLTVFFSFYRVSNAGTDLMFVFFLDEGWVTRDSFAREFGDHGERGGLEMVAVGLATRSRLCCVFVEESSESGGSNAISGEVMPPRSPPPCRYHGGGGKVARKKKNRP